MKKETLAKNYVESIRTFHRRPGLQDIWLAGFDCRDEILKKFLHTKLEQLKTEKEITTCGAGCVGAYSAVLAFLNSPEGDFSEG